MPLTFVLYDFLDTFNNFLNNEACAFERSLIPSENDAYNLKQLKIDSKVNDWMTRKIMSTNCILIMEWSKKLWDESNKRAYHPVTLNWSKIQSQNTAYGLKQRIYDRNGDGAINIPSGFFVMRMRCWKRCSEFDNYKKIPYRSIFCYLCQHLPTIRLITSKTGNF